MKYILSVIAISLLIPVLLLIIFTPEKCDHTETQMRYVFTSEDSTAQSDAAKFCKECDERLTAYALFKGTPTDQSYLAALIKHSDSSEILPGEYYTVTATVPLGFYGHGSKTVWLTCEVENEDFVVRFNVEFKEEYREFVESVEKGDKVTFRGRFYDEGCGFTDCELIS